jgi:DNA-binding LacI/PurR family transcriptional regulator
MCGVESHAGMAVLTVAPALLGALTVPERRARVLAIARELGYSHVAVELAVDAARASATVSRD